MNRHRDPGKISPKAWWRLKNKRKCYYLQNPKLSSSSKLSSPNGKHRKDEKQEPRVEIHLPTKLFFLVRGKKLFCEKTKTKTMK